jgi:hypothetical protein
MAWRWDPYKLCLFCKLSDSAQEAKRKDIKHSFSLIQALHFCSVTSCCHLWNRPLVMKQVSKTCVILHNIIDHEMKNNVNLTYIVEVCYTLRS